SILLIFSSIAQTRPADTIAHRERDLKNQLVIEAAGGPVDAKLITEAARKDLRIEIKNAVIASPLQIALSTFENEIVFLKCGFQGFVDFSRVTAKRRISFSGCRFEQGVSFQRTVVEGDAEFGGVSFEGGSVDFEDVAVKGVFIADAIHAFRGVRSN